LEGLARPEGRRTAFVIFGAAGSLATGRLLPAVQGLVAAHEIPRRLLVVGLDLKPPPSTFNRQGFAYIRGDLARRDPFELLSAMLAKKLPESNAECAYYLATAPQLFTRIIGGLEESGLDDFGASRKILVEKPFGTDLASSRALQKKLEASFGGARVYRIDHFLAKAGVRELARTRRATAELEATLNSDCVDQVQIVADEAFGVERRATFYDKIGVMRDMFQNHLLQVLCQVAMELPTPGASADREDLKADLLRQIAPPSGNDVVWGQYSGYRSVKGVDEESRTPTFVALRLSVKGRRWRGVPFYIRTGKRLRRTLTKAVIVFKRPAPVRIRGKLRKLGFVSFEIDPRATVVVGGLKREAGREALQTASEVIRSVPPQDEYELLLREALTDDHSFFVGDRFNGLAWKIADPAIKELEEGRGNLMTYRQGSDGPAESGRLLRESGRIWY